MRWEQHTQTQQQGGSNKVEQPRSCRGLAHSRCNQTCAQKTRQMHCIVEKPQPVYCVKHLAVIGVDGNKNLLTAPHLTEAWQ